MDVVKDVVDASKRAVAVAVDLVVAVGRSGSIRIQRLSYQ